MNRISLCTSALLFIATLSSCTQAPTVDGGQRSPNALETTMNVRGALSEIISSKTASSSEVENLVLAVARIYLVSQDYLRAFDLRLDELLANPKEAANNDLMSSLEYTRLMTTRLLSEAATGKVVEKYETLMRAYWDATDKKLDTLPEIKSQLREFRTTLNGPAFLQNGYRIALQDLAAELESVPTSTYVELHGDQAPIPKEVAEQSAFSGKYLFTSDKELQAFTNDKSIKAEFKAMVTAATQSEQVIHRQVSLLSPLVQLELEANIQRQPQSIGPGTGANGNLNGGNFPPRTWSLTFDDGPSNRYTMQIINNLQRNAMKATFFWLARNVGSNGRAVAAAKASYQDLNNHSYSHANLVNLDSNGLYREIVTSTAIETRAYGTAPRYFRCPYGSGLNSSRVRSMIAQQGMVHVFWNVDSLDWRDHNASSIVARTRKQMQLNGHGIILFHDIHPQSVTASNVIMSDLKSLRPRTIAQVVQEMNGR